LQKINFKHEGREVHKVGLNDGRGSLLLIFTNGGRKESLTLRRAFKPLCPSNSHYEKTLSADGADLADF
jgi:hypothetical protein